MNASSARPRHPPTVLTHPTNRPNRLTDRSNRPLPSRQSANATLSAQNEALELRVARLDRAGTSGSSQQQQRQRGLEDKLAATQRELSQSQRELFAKVRLKWERWCITLNPAPQGPGDGCGRGPGGGTRRGREPCAPGTGRRAQGTTSMCPPSLLTHLGSPRIEGRPPRKPAWRPGDPGAAWRVATRRGSGSPTLGREGAWCRRSHNLLRP